MNDECRFVWYDSNGNHIVDLKGRLIEIESDCGGCVRNVTIHMVEHDSFDKPPYKTAQQLEEDGGVVVDATTKDIVMRNISKSMEKIEKGDEMSVKIKKPVKEISIDELRKGIEFEELKITIDGSKKDTIEKQLGLKYNYPNEIIVCDGEILFTDYIMEVHNHGYYPIPYDIIEKLEVREC